jgi:uncharacterized damage-inducible protein DinB
MTPWTRGVVVVVILAVTISGMSSLLAAENSSPEYAAHFSALAQLSMAVANAMPADQYGFRPHPESMTFGELMNHIAQTNYQFCVGMKDVDAPAEASATPAQKESIVKFLQGSFDYCAPIIRGLTDAQLSGKHNSPDGNLSGREVLLALYIHVAHHRGQAEIYLRDKGIKPPSYRI